MLYTINPNSIVPLYKQVSNILIEKINNRSLKPGDKLPSELSLMEMFKVSRITIRSAIQELVDDGLLERCQGKGTFVASQKALYSANDLPGFTQSCKLVGKKPSTKLLSIDYSYPSRRDSEFLNISETEQIIVTKRLRYVDGSPAVIEINHYNSELSFLFNEDLEGSLFEIFSKHNLQVTKSIRTLDICRAVYEEANLLNVKLNTPLLLFKDKQYSNKNKPFFVSKQLYNTDIMKFYI